MLLGPLHFTKGFWALPGEGGLLGEQAEVLQDANRSFLSPLCLAQYPAHSRWVIQICWENRVRRGGVPGDRRPMQRGPIGVSPPERYKLYLREKNQGQSPQEEERN